MEALPFPANVAAAPPVAAATLAQGMAFATGASFEHGGIVPGAFGAPVGVTAHGGEMYLGSRLSQTVQNMAAGGGSTRAGTTQHVRMNISPTFVVSHPLTDSDVRAHSRTIAMVVKQQMGQFNR